MHSSRPLPEHEWRHHRAATGWRDRVPRRVPRRVTRRLTRRICERGAVMAQYALPPGAVRRRTVFGLLDADGWGWASIKATFWFLLAIFLLGYVPDRAYYLTVSPTVDLGFNAISPINLCPGENDRGARKLPCPAQAG